MLNQELLNYIRESLKQKFSKDEIRDTLLNAGWRLDDIAESFAQIDAGDNAQVVMGKPMLSKKKMAVLASALAVFMFTGSSVFAGYYYYKTMPERTIKKMGERINEIKTFHYNAVLNFSGSDENTKADTEIKLDGAADASDENNIKSYSDIKFSSKDYSGISGINEKERKISLDISHKKVDNVNYLKFEVPQEGNNEEVTSFIKSTKANGEWVEISAKDLEELAGAQAFMPIKQLNEAEPDILSSDADESEEQIKKIEKLKEIFLKYKLFDANEYIGSETIQGNVKARHIKFTANKEELKNFLLEASAELGDSAANQYGMEEYKKDLEEGLDTIETIEGDIWIGKEDYFLHKIEAKVAIKDGNSEGNFNFSMEFSDINKPVIVEAPDDAMPVMDVLKNVLGGGN